MPNHGSMLRMFFILFAGCAQQTLEVGPKPGGDAGPGDGGLTTPPDASHDLGGFDSGIKPPPGCNYADNVDHDGDGFAATDGDCNDCDPNVNPGALDVPKNT